MVTCAPTCCASIESECSGKRSRHFPAQVSRSDDLCRLAPAEDPPDDLEEPAGPEGHLDSAVAQVADPLAGMPLPFLHVGCLLGGEPHDHGRGLLPYHAEGFLFQALGIEAGIHREGLARHLERADPVQRQGCDVPVRGHAPDAVEPPPGPTAAGTGRTGRFPAPGAQASDR